MTSVPIVFHDNWETYVYIAEDRPAYVSFYAGSDEIPREDFPYCARVLISIKAPNENGGPVGNEAEVLWQMEDTLADALAQQSVPCILLARLTHAGIRELIFQLADWDRFRRPVGNWMQQVEDYEVDVSEHNGWDFFDECIWPDDESWQFIYDRRVVTDLIESGSDPEKEHDLEFVFYGDDHQVQQLRQRLEARGYVDDGLSDGSDRLVMIKKLPLDLDAIHDESLENHRLCEDLGAVFDGWGASVVK